MATTRPPRRLGVGRENLAEVAEVPLGVSARGELAASRGVDADGGEQSAVVAVVAVVARRVHVVRESDRVARFGEGTGGDDDLLDADVPPAAKHDVEVGVVVRLAVVLATEHAVREVRADVDESTARGRGGGGRGREGGRRHPSSGRRRRAR